MATTTLVTTASIAHVTPKATNKNYGADKTATVGTNAMTPKTANTAATATTETTTTTRIYYR